jgi:hypothetical protein
MSVNTYRCVDSGSDEIKYVCEHAYVTGPYIAEWGPADSLAETVLCLPCLNRMSAGEKEIRDHAPNNYKMHAFRASSIH